MLETIKNFYYSHQDNIIIFALIALSTVGIFPGNLLTLPIRIFEPLLMLSLLNDYDFHPKYIYKYLTAFGITNLTLYLLMRYTLLNLYIVVPLVVMIDFVFADFLTENFLAKSLLQDEQLKKHKQLIKQYVPPVFIITLPILIILSISHLPFNFALDYIFGVSVIFVMCESGLSYLLSLFQKDYFRFPGSVSWRYFLAIALGSICVLSFDVILWIGPSTFLSLLYCYLSHPTLIIGMMGIFFHSVCVGFSEEFLSRKIMFLNVIEHFPKNNKLLYYFLVVCTALASSALFGLMHVWIMQLPGHGLLSVWIQFSMGLTWCYIAFRSKDIEYTSGFHAGWDFGCFLLDLLCTITTGYHVSQFIDYVTIFSSQAACILSFEIMNYFSPLTTEEIKQSKDKFDLKVEEVDKAIQDRSKIHALPSV